MHAHLLQSCLTLCNAMDYSLPGFPLHGILQGKNTGLDCHILLQPWVHSRMSIFRRAGDGSQQLHNRTFFFFLIACKYDHFREVFPDHWKTYTPVYYHLFLSFWALITIVPYYFASFLVFLYLFLDCEHNEAKNQVYFIQHHLVQSRNPIFAESIIELIALDSVIFTG